MTNLTMIEKRIGKIESARDSQWQLSDLTDEEFLEYINDFLMRIDAGFQMKSLWDHEGSRQFDVIANQLNQAVEAGMSELPHWEIGEPKNELSQH